MLNIICVSVFRFRLSGDVQIYRIILFIKNKKQLRFMSFIQRVRIRYICKYVALQPVRMKHLNFKLQYQSV